tara:strand:- start:668 stop:1168 length:501 start_codon:yes stop_codon:yes gene_type:complete
MPQLNPEFFLSQVFWLVITFIFLLYFLWKVSLPKIETSIKKREDAINKNLEKAKMLQNKAETIQAKIDDSINKSKIENQQLIKKTLDDAQDKAEKKIKLLDIELEKKINESNSKIERLKDEALIKIKDEIFKITTITIDKLSGMQIDKAHLNEEIKKINFNSQKLN